MRNTATAIVPEAEPLPEQIFSAHIIRPRVEGSGPAKLTDSHLKRGTLSEWAKSITDVEVISRAGDNSRFGLLEAEEKAQRLLPATVRSPYLGMRDDLIASITALVIEIGYSTLTRLVAARFLKSIREKGFAHFRWNCYAHTPIDPRFTLLVPFSSPLVLASPQDWSLSYNPQLLRAFDCVPVEAKSYGDRQLLPEGVQAARSAGCMPVDRSLSNPSRTYALPCRGLPDEVYDSSYDQGEAAWAEFVDGRPFDPHSVVG